MGDEAIRVSDAERDEAVTALWTHYESGRLLAAEHEERSARAAAAKTRGDLEALFVDLPAPHPDLSAAVTVKAADPDETTPTTRDETTPATPDETTPATRGETLAGAGLMVLVCGVVAATVLTVREGMWWTFFPVVGLTTLLWVLSDVADRKDAAARKESAPEPDA
ncbi:DUF1707 domain-containing protein [Actinophytocola sp.]|uniref:DUF1707 SHOCT-like domain-containing protein n=1 Tax=Actinophytocola sp. TaxID=1872138 RepID=UPI002ED5CE6A